MLGIVGNTGIAGHNGTEKEVLRLLKFTVPSVSRDSPIGI